MPPKANLKVCFAGLWIGIRLVIFPLNLPSVYTENEEMILNLLVSVILTIPSESIEINWWVPSITFNDNTGDRWPYILCMRDDI